MSFARKIDKIRKDSNYTLGRMRRSIDKNFATVRFKDEVFQQYLTGKFNQGRPFTLYEAKALPLDVDIELFTDFENLYPDRPYTFNEMKYFENLTLNGNSFSSDDAGPNCLSEISFPETVTVIPKMTLYKCEKLESVHLPSRLKRIGEMAFCICTGLKEINLPEGLEFISQSAFGFCESLKSIVIPRTVANIGTMCFSGCKNLQDVTFEEGSQFNAIINASMFSGCTALESINLPDTVYNIDSFAFKKCSSLRHIRLPINLYSLGVYVFSECTELKNIEFPPSFSSFNFGMKCFDKCTSLNMITVHSKIDFTDAFGNDIPEKSITLRCPRECGEYYTRKAMFPKKLLKRIEFI